MKCQKQSILMRSSSYDIVGLCNHKFCQSCFRKENADIASTLAHKFICPCCHTSFYANIQSIDEAVLIGEAVTMRTHIFPSLKLAASTEITDEKIISVHAANKIVIEQLEVALQLNPTNFYTLYLLFLSCSNGHTFLTNHEIINFRTDCYLVRLFDYSFRLLDNATVVEQYDFVRSACYDELTQIFYLYHNYPSALKYAKLPPLRFAVGDEVEILHELETGSEWKLGKVVELYYRERDFAVQFNAPYRLQLLDDSDSTEQPPVYAWVKADLDRYVRKVGVRSIEDTRYQARLDAKVEELTRVYCSKEFLQDIYRTLAQDREFVEMLQSVWQVELSEDMLCLYRMLVLYRQPLIRTDSGYHISTAEEVIAGIRAFFNPVHLSSDATSSTLKNTESQRVRDEILCRLSDSNYHKTFTVAESDVQGLLLASISNYLMVLTQGEYSNISAGLHDDSYFAAPPEISDAISKASSKYAIRAMVPNVIKGTKVGQLLITWNGLLTCLDNPDAGTACECPWTFFFVKHCLDHGAAVPKLALDMYDRMNMQLSREFIRCANPSCELNKLDKSTGKIKFKQCSRCLAVIYCSRECQVAHYPDHKTYCMKVTSAMKTASQTTEQKESDDNGEMDRCD